jgi:hypothetical protein
MKTATNLTEEEKEQIKEVIKLIKLYPEYNADYLINMFETALKNN